MGSIHNIKYKFDIVMSAGLSVDGLHDLQF